MNSQNNLKLVLASLFAALCCVGTMLSFPTPNGGYIHPGDSIVLLTGIFLGPLYGGAAAGIGSALSDLLLGYVSYAPATLVIKTLVAMVAAFIFHSFMYKMKSMKLRTCLVIFCGIAGGILVTGGYFLFESKILGLGLAATASILSNLIQNLFGIVLSALLFPVLYKIRVISSCLPPKNSTKGTN